MKCHERVPSSLAHGEEQAHKCEGERGHSIPHICACLHEWPVDSGRAETPPEPDENGSDRPDGGS